MNPEQPIQPQETMTHAQPVQPSAGFVMEQAQAAVESAVVSPVVAPAANPQAIYPEPTRNQPQATQDYSYAAPNNDLQQKVSILSSEYVILAVGLFSPIAYVLTAYLIKHSNWAPVIVAMLFAATTMYLAIQRHRNGYVMSPLVVIGLSSATAILVTVMSTLLLLLLLKSAYGYPY